MPPAARVIVATYNQLPLLRKALRGYLRQTTQDFALTVADDGSGDDTREWIDAFRPELEAQGVPLDHVWHADRGFRKTVILNEAVRRSAGEPLLVFSDGDCIPPAHFVERHLAAHEPRSLHVGGAIRLSEEVSASLSEADIDAGRYEGLGTTADAKDLRRRKRKSEWGMLRRRKRRPKILGLNFALDRSLFEGINGFDERFLDWGVGEDSDVRDRAMRYRPRACPKILYTWNDVYHLWHPVRGSGALERHSAYYDTDRPVFCERGLVQDPP